MWEPLEYFLREYPKAIEKTGGNRGVVVEEEEGGGAVIIVCLTNGGVQDLPPFAEHGVRV